MEQRRQRGLLICALGVVAVLGVVGARVEDSLSPTSLDIAGTESARTATTMKHYFGDSASFAILLWGPREALDRQGPALVRALRRDPAVSTLSPWDRGAVPGLRPRPDHALVLADFHVPPKVAIERTIPQLEDRLSDLVHPPVKATYSGFAAIYKALQDESLSASERGELIAMPVLLVVLLLVFGSPIAAVIPLIFGALTVLASRGILVLLTNAMAVDGLALVVCTMMGLALGVDYSLLMVSRFREEMRAGATAAEAGRRTRAGAGRTVVFAGVTLFLAVGLSAFLQPGYLLASMAVTMLVVTCVSVAISLTVVPVVLTMLGANVDRWNVKGRLRRRSKKPYAPVGVLRRPRLATLVVLIPVLLLAAPAAAFKTGPPTLDELPPDNDARVSAERIDEAVGGGWGAPFVVTAVSRSGPILDPARLRRLGRWQRTIAADPRVQAVFGPGSLQGRLAPLGKLRTVIADRDEKGPLSGLESLGPKLHRASGGVSAIRSGLSEAANGAALLSRGSGLLGGGAETIASAVQRAGAEGGRATSAASRLADGSQRLLDGQKTARLGSLSLKLGFGSLAPNLEENGLARARRLRDDLARQATGDPGLDPAAAEAQRLVRRLAAARDEVRHLRGLTTRLNAGLGDLVAGGTRLNAGAERLADGVKAVPEGFASLGDGTSRLAAGAGRLSDGADALARNLSSGFSRSQPLEAGMRRADARVAAATGSLKENLNRVQEQSPGFASSGYLALGALDGAEGVERGLAEQVVDVDGGGTAARFVVVPEASFESAESTTLYRKLERSSTAMGKRAGVETGVTGGGATVADFNEATRTRPPLVIGTILLATFLCMLVILRAPLLAALAVGLNLLSVGAAIGVISLLLRLPADYPLGGHGHVDAVGGAAIFGITFGLSIDYAVFLLIRMREHYDTHGEPKAAIEFGLERTAGVITGAAAIMTAVFVAFATSSIATVSQMGVGLTVAVLLDATVIRIVLLPSLMLLLGDRVWAIPGWLDRILPRVRMHAGTPSPASSTT